MREERISSPMPLVARFFGDFLSNPAPETKWLVDGLLPVGVPGLIAAVPNAGKSWIMAQMVVAVATGKSVFGSDPCPPAGCVFLSLEDPEDEVHRRVQSIVESYKFDGDWTAEDDLNLSLNACVCSPKWEDGGELYLPTQVENLRSVFAQFKTPPSLLLIDTFAAAAQGDENKAEAALPIMQAAHALSAGQMTVLISHHVVKGQSGARQSVKPSIDEAMDPSWVRGSGAIWGSLRFMIQLVPLRPDQAEKLGLDAEKSRRNGYCVYGCTKGYGGRRAPWVLLEQVDYGKVGSGTFDIHPNTVDLMAKLKGSAAVEALSQADRLLVALWRAAGSTEILTPEKRDEIATRIFGGKKPLDAIKVAIGRLRKSGFLQAYDPSRPRTWVGFTPNGVSRAQEKSAVTEFVTDGMEVL